MVHYEAGTVFFVGAGPGDPDLLTLAGAECIRRATLVLYAGSLVPRDILPKDKPALDTATMTLETIADHMTEEAGRGGCVARVHTGDPSLYGALREEIAILDRAGIPWRIIPGVTAAMAAAANAGISFTTPSVTQSLIITRVEGRTPMPQGEALALLASHRTSLAIYLSGQLTKRLQDELQTVLPAETPVLCAHKVGHADEKLRWTTLDNLNECIVSNNMEHKTVILVLPGESLPGKRSCLYDASFSHGFRQAEIRRDHRENRDG